MKWRKANDDVSNYEDRRGRTSKKVAAGGGIITVVIVIVSMLLGKNPTQLLQLAEQVIPQQGQTQETVDPKRANENEELKVFSLRVFNSANDVWAKLFPQYFRAAYANPTFVTFTDHTVSACGAASESVGPFYCSADQKVYIDLDFFHELANKFGAPGELAMAYVIAHEIGHHVQHLQGTLSQVHQARSQMNEKDFNKLNVMLELQADFYAGLWARQAEEMGMIELEMGDMESAIRAAEAIGDDTLQKQAQGYVVPDAFTHGSSAQRMHWFEKGYRTGDPRQGDTFNDPSLR